MFSLEGFIRKNPQATSRVAQEAGFKCSKTKFLTIKTGLGLGRIPKATWVEPLRSFLTKHPKSSYQEYLVSCWPLHLTPVSRTTFTKYRPCLGGAAVPAWDAVRVVPTHSISDDQGAYKPKPSEAGQRPSPPPPNPPPRERDPDVRPLETEARRLKKLGDQVEYFLGVFPQGTHEQFIKITGEKLTQEEFTKLRFETMDKFPMLKSRGATYNVVFSLDLNGVTKQTLMALQGLVAGLNRQMVNPLQVVIYNKPHRVLEVRRVTL